jgi:hypothetical protein
MSMNTVRVAYRDDDRTPVIYCIKEIGAKHYGINVEVLKIKDYGAFEASLFNDSADVLIDHVEFLYAEAAKGKKITFFCAPRIVRGLDLMVPKHVENVSEFTGTNMAVRDSGRPYNVTLWLRMMGLEGKVGVPIFKDADVGRWGAVEKSRQRRMHRLLYGSPVSSRAFASRFKIPPGARARRGQPLRSGVHCRVRAQKICRIKKLCEGGHSWDLLDEISQAGSHESCHGRADAANEN